MRIFPPSFNGLDWIFFLLSTSLNHAMLGCANLTKRFFLITFLLSINWRLWSRNHWKFIRQQLFWYVLLKDSARLKLFWEHAAYTLLSVFYSLSIGRMNFFCAKTKFLKFLLWVKECILEVVGMRLLLIHKPFCCALSSFEYGRRCEVPMVKNFKLYLRNLSHNSC